MALNQAKKTENSRMVSYIVLNTSFDSKILFIENNVVLNT
jgi:hypothetical protein